MGNCSRLMLSVMFVFSASVLAEEQATQSDNNRPNKGEQARSKSPPAHIARGQGDRRRHSPKLLSNKNEQCLVTIQKYCLGGDIDEQMQRTPAKKYATYGLRDIYRFKNPKGGSTVLYVVDNKIANILVRLASPPGKGKKHNSRIMNRKRGLIRSIFADVNQFAKRTGQTVDQNNRQYIDSSVHNIAEKGEGAHSWDFDKWQFYFELNNKGEITIEGWVPELEKIEKNALVLKPGHVLNGMWHKKHPIELTINSQNNKALKATVRFKKLKNGLYENPVEITQIEAGKLHLVRFVEDGSKQSFISQIPKGNAKRCYVWRISIQDKENDQAYKDDGTLQLCP